MIAAVLRISAHGVPNKPVFGLLGGYLRGEIFAVCSIQLCRRHLNLHALGAVDVINGCEEGSFTQR